MGCSGKGIEVWQKFGRQLFSEQSGANDSGAVLCQSKAGGPGVDALGMERGEEGVGSVGLYDF